MLRCGFAQPGLSGSQAPTLPEGFNVVLPHRKPAIETKAMLSLKCLPAVFFDVGHVRPLKVKPANANGASPGTPQAERRGDFSAGYCRSVAKS